MQKNIVSIIEKENKTLVTFADGSSTEEYTSLLRGHDLLRYSESAGQKDDSKKVRLLKKNNKVIVLGKRGEDGKSLVMPENNFDYVLGTMDDQVICINQLGENSFNYYLYNPLTGTKSVALLEIVGIDRKKDSMYGYSGIYYQNPPADKLNIELFKDGVAQVKKGGQLYYVQPNGAMSTSYDDVKKKVGVLGEDGFAEVINIWTGKTEYLDFAGNLHKKKSEEITLLYKYSKGEVDIDTIPDKFMLSEEYAETLVEIFYERSAKKFSKNDQTPQEEMDMVKQIYKLSNRLLEKKYAALADLNNTPNEEK